MNEVHCKTFEQQLTDKWVFRFQKNIICKVVRYNLFKCGNLSPEMRHIQPV